MQLKKTAFWIAALALTTLSLMPTDFLPQQVFSLWDKAQHALGFAGLTLLGLLAYPQHRVWVPVLLLVLGGTIELAQAASGWRQGDWIDFLADAIGIAATLSLWWSQAGRRSRSA